MIRSLSGSGLEKMELERLQIVDAIKGYRSKSVRCGAAGVVDFKENNVAQTKKHPNAFLPLQTIFEINSTCKTQAGEVMRAKRSRDAQLVDKFNKQRDDKAAESLASRTVRPAADRDDTHGSDREEADLKVPPGGRISGLVVSQC